MLQVSKDQCAVFDRILNLRVCVSKKKKGECPMSKGFIVALASVLLVAVSVYGVNLYQQRHENGLVESTDTYAGVVPILDSTGSIRGVVYTFDTAPPGWRENPNFNWRRQFNVPPEITRAVENSTSQLADYHWRRRMLITVVQKSEGLKTTVHSKGSGAGDPGHLILTEEIKWDKGGPIGPLAALAE